MLTMLAISGYCIVGMFVGVYSRSRSYNKSFQRWKVENSWAYDGEKYNILETHKKVMEYDRTDISIAGFLGGLFWPFFLLGFTWHFLYKKTGSLILSKMPVTGMEKIVYDTQKWMELEQERKKNYNQLMDLIQDARTKDIPVKELEKIAESFRTKK